MSSKSKLIQIDFYCISSNFIDILLKLSVKLLNKEKNILISLNNDEDVKEIDKLLWIKDKNSFIPHKIMNQNITDKDKIIITSDCKIPGHLEKKFDTLIIPPEKSIKSFNKFSRYLVFFYKASLGNFIVNKENLFQRALQLIALKNTKLLNGRLFKKMRRDHETYIVNYQTRCGKKKYYW